MRLLHRLGFALWIGLLALSVSGTAQTQLSLNIINAAIAPETSHIMPDGTYMAGSMHDHGADQQGHTHKGHADCSLCGLVASMAAISVPVQGAVISPDVLTVPAHARYSQAVAARALHAPYASRAPPSLTA